MRRVRELARDFASVEDVIAFLRSPAGRAAAAAQRMALVGFPEGVGAFVDGMSRVRDPERVGEVARGEFLQVRDDLITGSSRISPLQLSWLNGSMLVTPEQAREIDRFYSSGVGERWLQIQQRAAEASYESRKELRRELCESGWARDRFEALDALLPTGESGR